LLHRYGVNMDGIPGGVPPLVYMMLWSDNPSGPRWLLDHGADANLAWGHDGEPPRQVAARRWNVPMLHRGMRARGSPLGRHHAGDSPHAAITVRRTTST
jgi:hypothetical protein